MKIKYLTQEQLHSVNVSTYMIWVMMDIAAGYVTDLESLLRDKDPKRQIIKQKLHSMKKLSTEFRKSLNSAHNNDIAKLIQFGDASEGIEIDIRRQVYAALKKDFEK